MPESKPKILIIEDDKFLAKMLGRMLESNNFEVLLAVNGKEALTKVSPAVGLILLDIMLPDVDGFDILKKIKTNPGIQKIPVIIISNLGQPEDVAQGKKFGAQDYIIKSDLSLEEVVKKVEKYLTPKK